MLRQPNATKRPDEQTWSPLEYACHVRDVHLLFGERLDLMLEQDEPTFANWDQDVTAVEERYDLQDPAVVGPELVAAAEAVAARYDAIRDAPTRPGPAAGCATTAASSPSTASPATTCTTCCTTATTSAAPPLGATVAAYDGNAAAYSDASLGDERRGPRGARRLADAVGAGRAVLEIGSAGGRDAIQLEERGLTVRRTDIAPAFVELMRSRGYDAEVLDPLTDELGGPYDGVWASACLLHVAREDLPTVLPQPRRGHAGGRRAGHVAQGG